MNIQFFLFTARNILLLIEIQCLRIKGALSLPAGAPYMPKNDQNGFKTAQNELFFGYTSNEYSVFGIFYKESIIVY